MTTNSPVVGASYEPPPVHLLEVLEELLTGDTDVTISRRLSISPRTFSRRVAELLEYLGVNNRFQAGIEVALRGWVPLETYRQTISEPSQRSQTVWR